MPVHIDVDGEAVEAAADLTDLSEEGAFVQTDADLEYGDLVRVWFSFDSDEMRQCVYEGEGFVVRRHEDGIAVEFEYLSEDLRRFVQRLVGAAEA
jgi:hypothetical protein